ncbi:hypothetical protein J2X31_002255 [Flavobacterium arsenatis]|uniref:Lipocalin-like domain-containing protein n=1 Tax=Flavobacterium arsenatis TaxID=1484332 RepID=A0ABU1TQS5_9FLAO|nr:hypothetical protein [Flavobacterium arsenatis]MDR6968238.1 hypothetical protein [Flavobacterium arsenatis]
MKKAILLLLLAIAFGCDKDDNTTTQALPPATQTGAGIFACKVNGKPFIDKSGSFNCFYQFVDGEYYFHITANDIVDDIDEITLYSSKIQLEEGGMYELKNYEDFSISGLVFMKNSFLNVSTTALLPGTLNITKLDLDNFIVSGTFNFQVINPITNQTIHITEGRFDSLFTQ